MSNVVPPKGHRHTRSAAIPPATALSQNPPNQHHFNAQAQGTNSKSEMSYSIQPTTPPRTPRKELQPSSQTKPNSTTHETGSKQKTRSKRPKNVMTSPAVIRSDRSTPPLTSAQSSGVPPSAKPIATPSTAAYAGPTFHASPAPSALPIPSFYSKSVPDSPGARGVRSLREPSLSASPTPVPAPVSNMRVQREESPLDFFFKADREEKARARSASSTQAAVPTAGPFRPPATSPRTSQTPPAPASQNHPRSHNRVSSSGIFAMELGGDSATGTPYGPAFSTPYSERISAARSSGAHEPSVLEAQQTMNSEALKAYLFSGHQLPNSTAPSVVADATLSQSQSNIFAHETNNFNHPKPSGRTSGLRKEVTPTRTPVKTPDRSGSYADSPTPSRMYVNSTSSNTIDFIGTSTAHATSPTPASLHGVSSGNRSADIKGMEDSLRKLLKLDANPGGTGSGMGDIPEARASVPNYVGGRDPPLNGMHNGVMGS